MLEGQSAHCQWERPVLSALPGDEPDSDPPTGSAIARRTLIVRSKPVDLPLQSKYLGKKLLIPFK